MEPEQRTLLERCMAAMAAGDAAFVFTFIEQFGGQLAGQIRRIVAEMGRDDILRDHGEIDGMVHDAAFFILDHAASWNPQGALPWTWAERGIRALVSVAVGHRVVSNDEDLDAEVSTAPAGVVHLGADDLATLAGSCPELRLVFTAALEVSSERNATVYVQYRVQQRLGDQSPAHTVAAMFDLSPANVRQIHHRVAKGLRPLLATARYQAIAGLPLLVA